MALAVSPAYGSQHTIKYPEESFRDKWDRGCPDWQSKAPYIAGISVDTERSGGVFRIISAARLYVGAGQSLDKAQAIAGEILSDGISYPEWVMPGINADPEGNPYFVSIDSATSTNYRSAFEYAILGVFSLSVLWIKREGATSILLKHESSALPVCKKAFELTGPQLANKVTYRMIPRPGVLDYMIGEAFVSRYGDHVDLKMRAVIKPASMLYQVIPERLIKAQVDKRARRIFENLARRHADRLSAANVK